MYKRNAQGWSKHFDFFLVDEAALQLSFLLAVFFRHQSFAYLSPLYRTMGILLILIDALVLVLRNTMHNVVSRGYYKEIAETVKHCFVVFAFAVIYMFAAKTGDVYSRIILFLTFLFHILIGYGTRLLWKRIIRKHGLLKGEKRNMLAVVPPNAAEDILRQLTKDELSGYRIAGVVFTEEDGRTAVCGCPVVADMETVSSYIAREWIDSVYIDAPLTDPGVIKLMGDCAQMAVPTHYHFPEIGQIAGKRFSEKIGGTTVLTTSINYATPLQVLMKRCFDIVAGLVGSLAALVIMAIVGPKIKKESPGPILFKQVRIGKNGRRFKMYKIRSMYMDAEARKQEFLEQNRVKDGRMFKLDFDPRIIGNKILPDGTKVTGIGDRIRRLSLDEWPQFFNVLNGSMSTVGTRPPTVDEWEKYELHHRARLAVKPGITGMWQVSGRSEITDFEEVVRLDTEYITNWSPGLDLRILIKTIGVLLSKKGAL